MAGAARTEVQWSTEDQPKTLSCHKREFTQGSGAPMISVTHYMTREGQMLADVSPRRDLCTVSPRSPISLSAGAMKW